MKRLVLASLVAPGIASAGLVIEGTKPAHTVQAAQQQKEAAAAVSSVQPVPNVGKETAGRPLLIAKAPAQEAPGKIVPKTDTPKAAEPKPAPTWTLTAGRTVGKELQAWGEKSGWKVIWNLPKDWAVPASTTFQGDFKTAASNVVKNLAANGAIIHAQFFDGNNTLVVSGPGVASQ